MHVQLNNTQQYKGILFSLIESFFFLILSIASCWNTLFSRTITTSSCGSFYSPDGSSKNNNDGMQILFDNEATLQQFLDMEGPLLDDVSLLTYVKKVSALLLVMASFVAVLSMLIMTVVAYIIRECKIKKKDTSAMVVDDVVKDRMGVSLGSSAVSLLCYNVTNHRFHGSPQPHDLYYWHIIVLLLCAVGLSFAISCLLAICCNFRKRDIEIIKDNKIFVKNLETDLVFMYLNRIILPMNGLVVAFTMIMMVGSSSNSPTTTTLLAGNNQPQNLGLIAIAVIFTIVQWALLQFYSPKRMSRNVFSFGEWMVVSCLISVMVTHYIVCYILPNSWFGLMTMVLSVPSVSSEMVVSQAGILGCLIGSTLNLECISNFWVRRLGLSGKASQDVWRLKCTIRLALVVVIVLYSIHMALWRSCNNDIMQPPWMIHARSSLSRSGVLPIMPIQWLFWFLRQKSHQTQPPQPQSSMQAHLSILTNYTWIIYWILVLFLSTPVAIRIAKKLNSLVTSNDASTKDAKRKKLTVISRKYFHVIAILLFVPPTIYAPEIMSLSYAIAVCFLIVLESIRLLLYHDEHQTTSSPSFTKSSTHKRTRIGSFTMKQVFETFLDEKDKCANKGSFAFTHMALVIGCALPLWLQQICRVDGGMNKEEDDVIAPLVGIIVLGVGDAAGAVVGSMVGKYKWPQSRKTMEGSMVMLVSMVLSSIWLQKIFYTQDCISWNSKSIIQDTMFLYLPLTVLEAVTLQIDNLCLPIVGYILIKLKSQHGQIVRC